MTDQQTRLDDCVTFPTQRLHPFDPPQELTQIRSQGPIVPLRYPDGHEGWLITGFALAREALVSPLFTKAATRNPYPGGIVEAFDPVPPGLLNLIDAPEHTRLRRLIAGDWSVKRMQELAPLVEKIVDEHVDALAAADGPVDLVQDFALSIPSVVICRLLGISEELQPEFHELSHAMVAAEASVDEVVASLAGLQGIIREVIRDARQAPGDGIISALVHQGEASEEEIVNLGWLFLVAGHETTANMLALGTLALLEHPDQWQALVADPTLMDNAVEELLRYLSIFSYVGMRAATDFELGGRQIKAGDDVAVYLPGANRDPQEFDRPDTLDILRDAPRHMAFAHGMHVCLGQHLARLEMRLGLAGLMRRFPDLRLAVPVNELRFKTDMRVFGVYELPIVCSPG